MSRDTRPYHERTRLRFACTACGDCCAGGGGYHVFLKDGEDERLRRYLGLSRGWFRRRYLRRLSEGDLVLASGGGGRCVFLQADGRCRVYTARPLQCRTYPFWPEVVASRAAWTREARRCEGIGRGAVVPIARIRALLRRQRTI